MELISPGKILVNGYIGEIEKSIQANGHKYTIASVTGADGETAYQMMLEGEVGSKCVDTLEVLDNTVTWLANLANEQANLSKTELELVYPMEVLYLDYLLNYLKESAEGLKLLLEHTVAEQAKSVEYVNLQEIKKDLAVSMCRAKEKGRRITKSFFVGINNYFANLIGVNALIEFANGVGTASNHAKYKRELGL